MEEKQDLKGAIGGLSWLSITDDLWYKAAEMSFSLRRKGITTSAIDTLIAAHGRRAARARVRNRNIL